jgi:PilZ domain
MSNSQIRELRVTVDLGVRIFGLDSAGKPFSNAARVVEISGEGAKLRDVPCVLKVDDVIGVQFGSEKSRFRVVWVGQPSTPEQGHIGIHCLERGKCLWSGAVPQDSQQPWSDRLPETPSTNLSPANTATKISMAASSAAERRRYPRWPCCGTVQMSTAGGNPNILKLLDISLGGFYAETMSTLPVGTTAELQITAQGFSIQGEGKVRTLHPSVGNGVAFTKMDEQNWCQLNELIACLGNPGATPPGEQSVVDNAMEALLQLLEARGVLTRAEFLQQLRQVTSRS